METSKWTCSDGHSVDEIRIATVSVDCVLDVLLTAYGVAAFVVCRPLHFWDRGFEYRWGHWYFSPVFVSVV